MIEIRCDKCGKRAELTGNPRARRDLGDKETDISIYVKGVWEEIDWTEEDSGDLLCEKCYKKLQKSLKSERKRFMKEGQKEEP